MGCSQTAQPAAVYGNGTYVSLSCSLLFMQEALVAAMPAAQAPHLPGAHPLRSSDCSRQQTGSSSNRWGSNHLSHMLGGRYPSNSHWPSNSSSSSTLQLRQLWTQAAAAAASHQGPQPHLSPCVDLWRMLSSWTVREGCWYTRHLWKKLQQLPARAAHQTGQQAAVVLVVQGGVV